MADLITRVYGGFRGVDFRGDEVNLVRSPDALNVWKDYKETESIRTRPKLKRLFETDGKVIGLYFSGGILTHELGVEDNEFDFDVDEGYFVLHFGKGSFDDFSKDTFPDEEKELMIRDCKSTASSFAFRDANVDYIATGDGLAAFDGTEMWLVSQAGGIGGYVPKTSIGRKPSGGGTEHQGVNMLSPYRINEFLGDGESTEYYLDTQDIDENYAVAWINRGDGKDYGNGFPLGWETIKDFTVDYEKGIVKFAEPPPKPHTDGQDNVSIQFSKAVSGYPERIYNCTIFQEFDNRIFASGNPDYPNTVWHSSLDDPSYWSDLDYYTEGTSDAAVKAMVAGNNALWVIKEPTDNGNTIFYHMPTIDSKYGKIYPSVHSNVGTGCVGKAINFNDDIVFFGDRGMEGISGDITTEQALAHRSTLVDRKLLTEPNYENMILLEWEGYLVVITGNKAYLADSRAILTNENHTEYEWFYWELDKHVNCARVYDGVIYVGTDDGVYALTDVTGDVESYWTTPKDKFKYPHKLKITNKRGCTVEAGGDVSVYAKTEGTEFELIGEYEGVTDYFVSRIKRKKFKDIQLKFHSKTRFSLETATLECFIGGYIKR